jgi:hypothetical protein
MTEKCYAVEENCDVNGGGKNDYSCFLYKRRLYYCTVG